MNSESIIGLATIEDLVEVIVGEIWDEYDIHEKTIFPMPDGTFLLKASEPLTKVNEELGLSLPSDEFSTVGGWILDIFGRIPKIGDQVRWDDLEIEILEADKKKILRVKIKNGGNGRRQTVDGAKMYYQLRSLVLRSDVSSEADKLVRLYTYEWGKISAIVPGQKR